MPYRIASFIGFMLTLVTATKVLAQEDTAVRRFSFFPFPVIYYAPETRFVFGAAAAATFRFPGDSLSAKPSTATIGVAYTQNKQFLAYLPFQLFFSSNRYYLFGEAGYYKYSYYFYGIGKKEVTKELYKVDFPRIKINATRLVLPHLYAGIRYQYEQYDIKETESFGVLFANVVPGANGSTTSGAGLQVVYDSRDTVLYPSHGIYGEFSFMNNGNTWGGNYNFNRYIADVAFYTRISKRIILALNSYNSFVTGNAPFQQQSLLGGNKKMRGYYEGRYIDKHLSVLQAEGRVAVYKRWGAVLFAGAGALGNETEFLRLDDIKYSYGGGLRFTVNRKDHLNIRLDYALGKNTSGIYFTIGEAF